MSNRNVDGLTEVLCNACDIYRLTKPNLTIQDILTSLERIRFALTEGLLERTETKH